MYITWYGTASIAIETEKEKILFDPFVTLPGAKIRNSYDDFRSFDHIFLTHGHLDHIASIPRLVKKSHGEIWCTKTPAKTLLKRNVKRNQIHTIQPGDERIFSDMKVNVLKGKHIQFDKRIIKKTLLNHRMIQYGYNLPWHALQFPTCPEKKETVSFHIQAEGKDILILGSLGIDYSESYPEKVDLLILPFQGASDLITPALEIIETIKPKRILLDHFDDAFPPISNTVPLWELKKWLKIDYPLIKVVKPKYRKRIKLS